MNFLPRWAWLRAARRPPARTDTPDAADMGTAFGLDATFRDLPEAAPQVPSGGAAPRLSRHTGLPRRD